jgi:hypothetical protein
MEVTMKRCPLALALAFGAVLAGPVSAQEAKPGGAAGKPEPSPAEAYVARRASVMVLVGSKLESPANFAFSNDLKGSAIVVYEQVRTFDPNNKKASEQLGFELKDGEWVLNETKRKKIDEYEDGSKGTKKSAAEFEKKLAEARKESARLLADLGKLAIAAGDEDAARSHFKAALKLDDQNPVANEKSGNRLVDGKWFTGRALAHKEFEKVYRASLAKAQALAVTPVLCDDSTKIAETAGITIRKYKTKNFRIESTLTDAEIRDILVWVERARQFYIDLYDVPEHLLNYEANPCVFLIVSTKEQHDKVIDACPQIPPEKRSFQKKFSGNILEKLIIQTAPNGETAQRSALHTATHGFVQDSFGRPAPWLLEALANSVAAAIKGADLVVCFSGEGSTGGINLERITLEQAPPLLRDQVLAGKDTPIAEFVKLPPDAMTPVMIAKAWSTVMFLLEMDRGQARGYFQAASQGGDGEKSKDDKVLKQYFQDYQTWASLDEAWRGWAEDVYKR